MSKDQNSTVNISVETVDNWSKCLAYMMTTLDFWVDNIDKKWPLNLILDGLNDISNEMFDIIKNGGGNGGKTR